MQIDIQCQLCSTLSHGFPEAVLHIQEDHPAYIGKNFLGQPVLTARRMPRSHTHAITYSTWEYAWNAHDGRVIALETVTQIHGRPFFHPG